MLNSCAQENLGRNRDQIISCRTDIVPFHKLCSLRNCFIIFFLSKNQSTEKAFLGKHFHFLPGMSKYKSWSTTIFGGGCTIISIDLGVE